MLKKEDKIFKNLYNELGWEIDNYIKRDDWKDTNNLIFTGCQIINPILLKNKKNENFSIQPVWDEVIADKKMVGEVAPNIFYHVTDLPIYEKLKQLDLIG